MTPASAASRWLRPTMVLLALVLSTTAASGESGVASIADQLDRVANDYGIRIEGLHLVDEQRVRRARGRPLERIRQLLTDYNYVLTQDIDGTIERVVILNRKRGGPRPIVLETSRRGNHHVVEGTVGGYGAERIEVSLLVDTGADFVVLPASMMDRLGLDPSAFERRAIQTANGTVDALLGRLPILQLGPEQLIDIDAAFIDDNRLQGTKLLGMSVLNRYRMTIDDRLNRITLIKSR